VKDGGIITFDELGEAVSDELFVDIGDGKGIEDDCGVVIDFSPQAYTTIVPMIIKRVKITSSLFIFIINSSSRLSTLNLKIKSF